MLGHKTYLYVIYFIIIINEDTRFSMESYIQSNSIGRWQEVQTKLLTNDNLSCMSMLLESHCSFCLLFSLILSLVKTTKTVT